MKIRMLMTRAGSEDGIHAQQFKAGEVYDLDESLAKPWLEAGVCEQDKMGKGPSEFKADEVPEKEKPDKKKKFFER
jgi:hypothetical protein